MLLYWGAANIFWQSYTQFLITDDCPTFTLSSRVCDYWLAKSQHACLRCLDVSSNIKISNHECRFYNLPSVPMVNTQIQCLVVHIFYWLAKGMASRLHTNERSCGLWPENNYVRNMFWYKENDLILIRCTYRIFMYRTYSISMKYFHEFKNNHHKVEKFEVDIIALIRQSCARETCHSCPENGNIQIEAQKLRKVMRQHAWACAEYGTRPLLVRYRNAV